ncbi:MAG: hypothetical protein AAF497_21820 [Planctomycetota bacterium]
MLFRRIFKIASRLFAGGEAEHVYSAEVALRLLSTLHAIGDPDEFFVCKHDSPEHLHVAGSPEILGVGYQDEKGNLYDLADPTLREVEELIRGLYESDCEILEMADWCRL